MKIAMFLAICLVPSQWSGFDSVNRLLGVRCLVACVVSAGGGQLVI